MLQEANNLLDLQIQQINEIIKTYKELLSKDLLQYLEQLTTTDLPALKGRGLQVQEDAITELVKKLNDDFNGSFQVEETINILNIKTFKPLDTKIHPLEIKSGSKDNFQSQILPIRKSI